MAQIKFTHTDDQIEEWKIYQIDHKNHKLVDSKATVPVSKEFAKMFEDRLFIFSSDKIKVKIDFDKLISSIDVTKND
ncbi:hypothetical protein M0R19_05350 [Candidatus Pacearchaeota archaeon]|jgi:hypothetical protein|nr:hypothetical protein [Candidatus Pacearchaeota archaeon]